jgi:hypothetical protein
MWPLMASMATSCACATISAVGKVPSQMRDFLRGSRTVGAAVEACTSLLGASVGGG